MAGTDWHDESYPELRDAPPWVMQEMIEAAPTLAPDPGLDRDRRAGRRDPGRRARGRARDGRRLRHEPARGRSRSRRSCRTRCGRTGCATVVEARDALEAALDPRDGGIALGVSHDGGTHATMLALQAARDAGAARPS